MPRLVSIGECMVELSAASQGLWHLGIAGDTLNTAWYARACLGRDWDVDYVTRLGADAFSDRALGFMAANGIGCGAITRHPSRSIGLYAIGLHHGERSFTYWRDASAARTLIEAAEVVAAAMAGAAVIHVSGISLAILPDAARDWLVGLMAANRQRGAIVSLDPNYRARLWPDAAAAARVMAQAAAASSVILPSFDDEATLFGDATPDATLARYLALGADVVVVKNGGQTIHLGQGGDRQVLAGLTQVTPIDTTGAGDSFNGAFLAGLATGLTPAKSALAAHQIAARVVQHPGALVPMDVVRGWG